VSDRSRTERPNGYPRNVPLLRALVLMLLALCALARPRIASAHASHASASPRACAPETRYRVLDLAERACIGHRAAQARERISELRMRTTKMRPTYSIALWVSPDPILANYMGGSPNGGVWNPGNLGLYTYSFNSPLRIRDPDGRAGGEAEPEPEAEQWGSPTYRVQPEVATEREWEDYARSRGEAYSPERGLHDPLQVVEPRGPTAAEAAAARAQEVARAEARAIAEGANFNRAGEGPTTVPPPAAAPAEPNTSPASSADVASAAVHGNTATSARLQWVYEIARVNTGTGAHEVVKYGISGVPANSNGLPRLNSQLNNLNRNAPEGIRYEGRIVGTVEAGRGAALNVEQGLVTGFSNATGRPPPGNARPAPAAGSAGIPPSTPVRR
jgi:hypothetical protein